MRYDITALFCCLDDFCKIFQEWEKSRLIGTERKRMRETSLSLSEMLTIMVVFHLSPCKNFKYFYTQFLMMVHKSEFKTFLSYNRFVQLIPRLFVPFCIIVQSLSGEKTGIYVVDSTTLPVCHNRRISQNKVFKGLAKRSKSTMGWFYGFKLHLLINDKEEIVAVKITAGNRDDRSVLPTLTKNLKGVLVADRGYLSSPLFKELYSRGLKLITGIRKNMKNYLMSLWEKLLLRKRFRIELVFKTLKEEMGLCHTRHRSVTNFCVHVISCLTAYQLRKKKNPTFKTQPLNQN